MESDRLYNTCMVATSGDKHYCRQVVKTVDKLSRERVVTYRDKRNVQHIVILPIDDDPAVEVDARKDRSLVVKIKSERYGVLIRYVYDSQLKPVHAVVSNLEYVNMLNIHLSLKDVPHEFFMRRGDYDE
jgi:hypothetical protein